MATATREKIVVNPPRKKFGRKSKPRSSHRPATRKNAGELYVMTLNPGSARGKGKMASHSKKRKKKYGSASHHNKARKARSNPGYRMKGKRNYGHRRHRRNPGGMPMGQLLMEGVFATAGAVGSKLLAQAVLGASNTGVIGYGANLVAGGVLGWAAGMANATRKYASSIWVGTIVALVIRVISDYTSYGSTLALSGLGDYQVQNFLVPQRVVDGLHSAQLQIPAGYGPGPVVVSSSAPPASHATGALSGLYDDGGLYMVN